MTSLFDFHLLIFHPFFGHAELLAEVLMRSLNLIICARPPPVSVHEDGQAARCL